MKKSVQVIIQIMLTTAMTPPSAGKLSMTLPKMVCMITENNCEVTNMTVLVTWKGMFSNFRVRSSSMTGRTGKLATPKAAAPIMKPAMNLPRRQQKAM